MRVTVIRDDGVVGIDGVFRKVDLSGMPEDVRAVQWNGESGHTEFYDDALANKAIDTIAGIVSFINLWVAAAPPGPPVITAVELRSAAHARINRSYENAVKALTAGYPQNEIDSWAKQEAEARAWLADNSTPTPWIDGAAATRGIPKAKLVLSIISNADALAPIHGSLTGKRKKLRDAIDALGPNPTKQQLDAIVW